MLDPKMRHQVEGEVTSPSQLVSIQELLRELLELLTEITPSHPFLAVVMLTKVLFVEADKLMP